MISRGTLLATALLAVPPAAAEVVDTGPGGFTVSHELVIDAPRLAVWHTAVDDIGSWWSDDHTVGGDASRLSIEPRPLGCFCERLGGDDGVVHLLVTSVSTGVLLRMTGGLGPLGLMGVNGNMTWEFFDAGEGTRLRLTYAVGGYRDGGLDTLAEPVSGVLLDALERLRARAEAD
jgi:uncharacterized protein YndB with AHSA1/START domain